MKKVLIYKLEDDGTQKTVLECLLKDTRVELTGDDVFKNNLETKGITDYSDEKHLKLFPKDGLKFLEQLKHNFTSGYLNASDVIDE